MDIKEYRKSEIPLLLIGCTLLLFLISGDLHTMLDEWFSYFSSAMIGAIVSIFVYIGDALISTKQKDNIIYLWKQIPQPGETVFERTCKDGYDKRFTSEEVKERYGVENILKITDDRERRKIENSIWYMASSRVKDETKILVSHRDYLMSRDMFFAIFEYLVLYVIFCLLMQYPINCRFIVFLIILMIAIRKGISTKATAFVDNVIAVDISNWKNEKSALKR